MPFVIVKIRTHQIHHQRMSGPCLIETYKNNSMPMLATEKFISNNFAETK